jgi:DNA-binding Lrp family transcriptional regulator
MHKLLAMDKDLDGVDLRVFMYLSSSLNFREPLEVSQREIADVLERRQEHISRSMRKLREKGIIIEGEKVGRSSEWRFNPNYGK